MAESLLDWPQVLRNTIIIKYFDMRVARVDAHNNKSPLSIEPGDYIAVNTTVMFVSGTACDVPRSRMSIAIETIWMVWYRAG